MGTNEKYDVAVAGGGLAGLSCAILLARKNYRVILFEKETYPFHKVCGEYISLESYDFIRSLGVNPDKMDVPVIKNLSLSSLSGTTLRNPLPLGGFGISRHMIDHELSCLAREAGVTVSENNKVSDIVYENDQFTVSTQQGTFFASVACGSFGKRSNIDVKWQRRFTMSRPGPLNNYIAVKYHAMVDHPRDEIALHIFGNGYCGISPIEQDKTCICYLTTAANLRDCGNSIPQLEKQVLSGNKNLERILDGANLLYTQPLVISQISFQRKDQVENHVLMLGDAAGMITPLCGNGMSMALHSSKMASALIDRYLSGRADRSFMETQYRKEWLSAFGGRLKAGRIIQSLFTREKWLNASLKILKRYPSLLNRVIRQTHGASQI